MGYRCWRMMIRRPPTTPQRRGSWIARAFDSSCGARRPPHSHPSQETLASKTRHDVKRRTTANARRVARAFVPEERHRRAARRSCNLEPRRGWRAWRRRKRAYRSRASLPFVFIAIRISHIPSYFHPGRDPACRREKYKGGTPPGW